MWGRDCQSIDLEKPGSESHCQPCQTLSFEQLAPDSIVSRQLLRSSTLALTVQKLEIEIDRIQSIFVLHKHREE